MSDSEFEYDVFLSFASLNEAFARPLWEQLHQSGLRVFWSDEVLKKKVGRSWYSTIEDSLERSRHLVLLWSPEAKKSKFVKREYTTFDSECFEPPSRLLVPVLIPGHSVKSLPLFLRQLQSFSLDDGVGELIRMLGGRYRPLEVENARLQQELEAAREEITLLKRSLATGKQAAETKAEADLKALKQSYEIVENRLAREEYIVADLEEEIKKLVKDNKAKDKRIAALVNQPESKEPNAPRVNAPEKIFKDDQGIEYILIEPGTFMMGDKGIDRTKPVHEVTISKPYYLGKYPLTQLQWKAVMGSNPSKFKGGDHPIVQVSWEDVQAFLGKANRQGTPYRLPTEAEWEYACRAGTSTAYSFGDNEIDLDDYAWYSKNAGKETHPVGEKKPNPWGLYDMHGNVWEWVNDWYGDYEIDSVTDPQGPEKGSYRVIRGGGWSFIPAGLRSADRYGARPGIRLGHLGFRLVRTVP